MADSKPDATSLRVDFYSGYNVSKSTLLYTRIIAAISCIFWDFLRTQTGRNEHSFPPYVFMTVWGNYAATFYFCLVVPYTIFLSV
mmetsp:Transcript_45123/g.52191  ORF Transcript_45123/g.52191 Transcript_45123/m.52191 type:complete len:85 (+) Transcript_45123:50-304(+)